ncbi:MULTISPECIES: hypothetical protein [Streptomyces]|uniref:hypothetical protein n=1 Tax=Streptomyces TaxID=1883 RepID=UPI0007019D0E|nr:MULTISPECIES: hypothetical protein [unclassified Streptomyces]WRY80106.1 hypothetical protein OG388_02185 [Streptomyces clavifer]KQZ17878.1 hypothetical protein ASD51_30840 [Streptomyces sp. Root55]MDX3068968.1 hypothetical protein [Streptomyces sp. ND04-05B]WRY86213.1 hypothetical protein OG388_35815 [Streptomyces clavifer]WRY86993.1 hypothetical protein OG388_38050 [Streptomyces clavifer]
MEIYAPLPGGICLPYPYYPLPKFRLPRAPDAVRATRKRITDTTRGFARSLRATLYAAAGAASVAGTTLIGIDPVEATSLGLNVTAALFAVAPLPAKQSIVADEQSGTGTTGDIEVTVPASRPRDSGDHRRWKRSARRFVLKHSPQHTFLAEA